MATFSSNLVAKQTRHRGIYSGQQYDVTGRIILAEGTVLATNDILLFVPIGENQRINKVKSYIIGSLPTATATIGYAQILGADGQPVQVDRLGPLGDADSKFISPASDLDAYATAAVFSTAREVVVPGGGKLPGPVYLAAQVATGGTVGAGGVEIHVGAFFDGETSLRDVTDPYGYSNGYLIGQ